VKGLHDIHVRAQVLLGGVRRHAWVLMLAVALVAGGAGHAWAQGPDQVAIVVQYGQGDVSTYCVSFDAPTITGLDALRQTGLDVVYEGGALGARVCKIGPVGCDLPGNCFCQCKGTECLYWSYWHLVDGTWQYALVGAASYQVAPGSVEGWSWGIGTPNRAPQPPPVTFAEVCAPAATTPVPATPPPAEVPTPTSQPTSERPSSPTPPTTTPAASATTPPTEVPTRTPTRPPAGGQQPSSTPAQPTSTQPGSTPTPGATRTPAATTTAVPASSAPAYTNYILFGVIVLVLVVLGAYVLFRRR
jgi:hypothetical protein